MEPATSPPLRLAVLISGGGTTLRNLMERIEQHRLDAEIKLVVSSSSQAAGLEFARRAGIPFEIRVRQPTDDAEAFCQAVFQPCRDADVQLVVMGGFLKHVLIPDDFVGRVMNIHPALIPAFCGQGFYGRRVHQAVIDYGVKVSGCTVHFVDNHYDHGPIVQQRAVRVMDDDSVETLAARVFELECEVYPEAIQRFAEGRLELHGRRVHCR